MHERILLAGGDLRREPEKAVVLNRHPCIGRVEYSQSKRQFTLCPTKEDSTHHVVLNEAALGAALGKRYAFDKSGGSLMAQVTINYHKKPVATIYCHGRKKVVDFIHLDEKHFERLVVKLFGSNKARIKWPILKKAKPLAAASGLNPS